LIDHEKESVGSDHVDREGKRARGSLDKRKRLSIAWGKQWKINDIPKSAKNVMSIYWSPTSVWHGT